MTIPEEKVAELKAANPGVDLRVIRDEDNDIEVVVRPASEAEYKRLRAQQSEASTEPMAGKVFLLGCLVYPSAADFAAISARYPAVVDTFSNRLAKIAGVTKAVTDRKL